LSGGHFLLATAAPPVESDYLLIWGVKARMFLAAAGIDWSYLEAPLNGPSHPDYPLHLPLLYDVYALVHGSWPEAWTGFPTFAFGFAALLAVRGLLADELPKLARVVATLILMPLLFSPFIGIGEAPLIAYAAIGVLYVKRGVAQSSRHEIITGAVFLGLAAWSKNEGLSLIGAVVIGMIVARRFGLLPATGDTRRALNALLRTRDDGTLAAALRDPGFDPIRGEPRFRDILRAVAPDGQ
jgi:hypothetical protein